MNPFQLLRAHQIEGRRVKNSMDDNAIKRFMALYGIGSLLPSSMIEIIKKNQKETLINLLNQQYYQNSYELVKNRYPELLLEEEKNTLFKQLLKRINKFNEAVPQCVLRYLNDLGSVRYRIENREQWCSLKQIKMSHGLKLNNNSVLGKHGLKRTKHSVMTLYINRKNSMSINIKAFKHALKRKQLHCMLIYDSACNHTIKESKLNGTVYLRAERVRIQ